MAESEEDNNAEEDKKCSSIVHWFDHLCFHYGDEDCIEVVDNNADPLLLGYVEVQEYSKALACQLYYRYRPHFVLVDCHGWPGAEVVAMMACVRLQIPFVPVSCHEQHAAKGRLGRIVQQLQQHHKQQQHNEEEALITAVTCCQDDQDPVLGVFQQANVHSMIFLDPSGSMREALNVPSFLPTLLPPKDDLYILFTSGTSGKHPKAVIGSHRSTLQRLLWFQQRHNSAFLNDNNHHGMFRVAQRTPLTFVDSIAERLGTLLTQNHLLVAIAPQPDTAGGNSIDMEAIVTQTQCHQITMLPSQLSQLLSLWESTTNTTIATSLQRIIISGEPCPESLWKRFQQVFYDVKQRKYACQLINLYGQTETTGDCCGAILTDLEEHQAVMNHIVTIGTPIRKSIIIHHPKLQQQRQSDVDEVSNISSMVEESHELVIAGSDCFANGYVLGINIPPAENGFIYEQHDDNRSKIVSFATGDMGFCRNGYWYVQGRRDEVEKIHGVWTSPSEVETAFQDYLQQQQQEEEEEEMDAMPAVAAAIMRQRVYLLAEASASLQPFSREHMKEVTRLPWNLIPHQVFVHGGALPRTPSTGKVDRAQLKQIILQKLIARQQQVAMQSKERGDLTRDSVARPSGNGSDEGGNSSFSLYRFQSLVASVLLDTQDDTPSDCSSSIDMSRSFVEVGGDSATAISLLYQVRMLHRDVRRRAVPIHAMDILNTGSLTDLWKRIICPESDSDGNDKFSKKPRLSEKELKHSMVFQPQPSTQSADKVHTFIEFAACVDVTPIKVDHQSLLAACQNGVVQKIFCGDISNDQSSVKVLASRHLEGWRISSDPIYTGDSIIVGGNRHPKELFAGANNSGAVVVSFSKDLDRIQWSHDFSYGTILRSLTFCQNNTLWALLSSSPTMVEESEDPCSMDENMEHGIVVLNVLDGNDLTPECPIVLPVKVIAKPLFLSKAQLPKLAIRSGGTSDSLHSYAKSAFSSVLIYASSDWDTGLFLVDTECKTLVFAVEDKRDYNRFFSSKVGPIYKDLVAWNHDHEGCCFLAADSWGSLHRIDLASMECTTLKLSNSPLSSPAVLSVPSSTEKRIVVGGYDGMVWCIDAALSTVLWECKVDAVVYTKPLVLTDHSIVVCTTAGEIFQLYHVDGTVLWNYRISVGAEIWSDPVEITDCTVHDDSSDYDNNNAMKVAFGARDSRLHMLQIRTAMPSYTSTKELRGEKHAEYT